LSKIVLDASALLAYLHREPGCREVQAVLPQAVIGAVNLCEVMTKLVEAGLTELEALTTLRGLRIAVIPFDRGMALHTGALRKLTKPLGMSLGDRACVALGMHLSLPVMTTDRNWQALSQEVQIQVIR